MVDGVSGKGAKEVWLVGGTLRMGDEGRRSRLELSVDRPKPGEILRLPWPRSTSSTDDRIGEVGGKASSVGLRKGRTRLGD